LIGKAKVNGVVAKSRVKPPSWSLLSMQFMSSANDCKE